MLYLKTVVITIALALLGGCTFLQGSKLLASPLFGLVRVTSSIYVEAEADEQTRANLRESLAMAERAVRATYGEVRSHPVVHACVSEACYRRFGGGVGSIAKVYGQRILLSPRGLNWHFLAHEWSHAELHERLTFRAWFRTPQWFDEGVAVAIGAAPEHSEGHWQFLIVSNVPRPTREELYTFKSRQQWSDAVSRYGENKNIERKQRDQPEVRPVYAAAGHELRPWLAKAGTQGLLQLIQRVNDGEDFESVYQLYSSNQSW